MCSFFRGEAESGLRSLFQIFEVLAQNSGLGGWGAWERALGSEGRVGEKNFQKYSLNFELFSKSSRRGFYLAKGEDLLEAS